MGHQCYIDTSSVICFEHSGELWIKEYGLTTFNEGRTYKVNFCPECGFKLSKKPHLNYFMPLSTSKEPSDVIKSMSMELANTISDMNHNIQLIKSFMTSQDCQNQCFMDRELELSSELSILKSKVEELSKK